MTTPSLQPQEYIITEECAMQIVGCTVPQDLPEIIRSRPHTSPPAPESIDEREDRELNIRIVGFEEGYAQGKEEAAKAAREQVLDEIFQYCKGERDYCEHEGDVHENYSTSLGFYARVYQLDSVMTKIESLRAQQQGGVSG